MPGGVSLAERTNHRGVKTVLLKLSGKSLPIKAVAKVAPGTFNLRFGGGSSMPDNPGLNAESARIKGRSGWKAGCIRGVTFVEYDPFAGELINCRTGVSLIPVASKVVRSKAIDVDVKNSHFSMI